MILTLDGLEPALSAMLESKGWEAVLNEIFQVSYALSVNPSLKGRTLFLPQLDAFMHKAAMAFVPAPMCAAQPDRAVHVVTEVYETGGHTRVVEDIVQALPEYHHMVILTDAARRYHLGQHRLGILEKRFKALGLEMIFLQDASFMQKTSELAALIAQLAPQVIFLQAHHYDTIANAGVAGHSAPRVVYFHHCDHNPALGAMRNDFLHVDPSPACYAVCNAQGHSQMFLGLSMPDCGVLDFSTRIPMTGAVCGSPHKFEGRNGFSYGELLAALFAGGLEKMHHIGTMPEKQQESIRNEIHAAGQDAARVIFHPNTPVLSQRLKELAPSFFMISHPVAGGKATIEAMSLSLPLLFPRPPGALPLLSWDMSGNAQVIETLLDAPSALARLGREGEELGHRSRDVFEKQYAMSVYRAKLLRLVA